jgi:hypothetical protein
MYAGSCLVHSLYLNALRQDDANERLKVLEWTVAKAIAEHDYHRAIEAARPW